MTMHIKPGPIGVLPARWRIYMNDGHANLQGSLDGGVTWVGYLKIPCKDGTFMDWTLEGSLYPLYPEERPTTES